ncbi:hypothetical protein Taro_049146 [Colocasia esculenta]|uniref:EF-hand domain-containing protein n=1 Tax=Colocasia esculenta TaxID=4460 RepID=A0A843XA67_COLES|nr:hypothetical protein [Colocasia esculenta]
MAICKQVGRGDLTMEEFKEWLMQFDADHDGRINREELRRAIRCAGRRFSSWKCGRAIREADADGNGFIDEVEIANLMGVAQSILGFKVV